MCRSYAVCFAVLFWAVDTELSHAATLWDETIHGDLSNDRLNPTSVTLGIGANSLSATSVSGDREYVHLQLPTGYKISAVNLVSYSGTDGTAFIGLQAGTTLTEPPTGTNVANMLGYTHFGTGPDNVGQDILPEMGEGAGAIGFTPPLTGTDYTFWIQQTGTNAATFQFDFVTVPEPATAALAFIALMTLCGTAMLRCRKPRQ